MAEVLGAVASGVTLAALFRTCIEAFDLIQTSRHQEGDFKKLKLRLDIEKCRLYIWGELIGLTNTSEADQDRPIDRVRFPEVVREILKSVFELFHDSHKIRERYGCRQATSDDLLDTDQNGPIRSLAASFSNFSIPSSHHSRTSRIIQNLVWVIHDRKKFSALVAEIKDLIDSLQGITSPSVPVARQEGKMRRKIVDIRDTETLSLIAEVCSEDHPDIADVASTKADTISLPSSQRRHVVAWIEDVQEVRGEQEERMSPDLESLTVTELKQKLLEMLQERKERGISSFAAPEPLAVPPLAEAADSPSAPNPAAKVPSITPASTVSPNTRQERLTEIHIGRSNIYESVGYLHTSNQPCFTNPWEEKMSLAHASPLPVPSSSGFAVPWRYPTSAAVNSPFCAHSHQYIDPPFSELGVSQVSLELVQQSLEDRTPRNIYEKGRQQARTENCDLPTTSSVSSMSASSNHDHLYNAESASQSVNDPTDGSSVASLDKRTLPAPKSKMDYLYTASSHTEKKHKCKVCGKRFTRPSSLQTHMYSHTGEKPYPCEVEGCGRHFSVVSNLRRHRKVHKREERGSELGSEMSN